MTRKNKGVSTEAPAGVTPIWDGRRALMAIPGTNRFRCAECPRWFRKLATGVAHINKAHS